VEKRENKFPTPTVPRKEKDLNFFTGRTIGGETPAKQLLLAQETYYSSLQRRGREANLLFALGRNFISSDTVPSLERGRLNGAFSFRLRLA